MPLKDNILSELEKSREADLSGQVLAETFGVSRNAVWKAINALKRDGYDILSSTNRGYRLSPDCDRLSAEKITSLLDDKSVSVVVRETVGSTNDEAKKLLSQNGGGNFLVLAEEQTSGRGRQGKQFFSPKSTGLYMTLAMSRKIPLSDAVGITSYAAVCVAKAINNVTGREALIKWVNDVFLDGKKICGILTEAVSDFESGMVSAFVIGVGINLRPADVPENLRNIVGFLDCRENVKNTLAAAVANLLLYYKPGNSDYIEDYKKLSFVLGKNITYTLNGETKIGEAVDIDKSGGLVVKSAAGTLETLKSGEISVRVNR
jgi:BirA family biotin operon repressor/biotin-[acetyl-CoA-carboxylase] ligase